MIVFLVIAAGLAVIALRARPVARKVRVERRTDAPQRGRARR